jgi:ABC-type enterochelin transport system permease subunit
VSFVSPLAIRRRLTRLRGSLVAVACVMALAGAVVAHHTEMPGDMGLDMHGVVTMVTCLGVVGLAAVAVGALPRLGRLVPGMPRPSARLPRELVLAASGAHPTRAGPPLFLVLAVVRR